MAYEVGMSGFAVWQKSIIPAHEASKYLSCPVSYDAKAFKSK